MLAVSAFAAPPRAAMDLGRTPPQENAGVPGFASLFPNAEAYTPGMKRSGGRSGRGGFNGGRIGPGTGYSSRNGARPAIPTPPVQLGRSSYGGRRY